jgi:hypothetical protein
VSLLLVSPRQRGSDDRLGDVPADASNLYEGRTDDVCVVSRGFCSRCGTQVCFTASFLPGLIDMTIGSLDAPESLPPTIHYWDSKRLPWMRFADDLQRYPEFPPPP